LHRRAVLGLDSRAKPVGPIYQSIDAVNLTARNDEVSELSLFGPLRLRYRRFVEADLEPLSASRLRSNFDGLASDASCV
jgi:hypothetical protein